MEDPDIIVDLRSLNGKDGTRFDVFWDHCKIFLNESVAVAVDDRRHCQVTPLLRVILIGDLVEQVMAYVLKVPLYHHLNGCASSFGQ